jgi:hypothetical protein
MTVTGQFKNGSIELEAGAPTFPDGTKVQIELPDETSISGGSLADVFEGLIGCIDNLPPDFAENHDHYIHGTAKRTPGAK